jgi:hypothetical protein
MLFDIEDVSASKYQNFFQKVGLIPSRLKEVIENINDSGSSFFEAQKNVDKPIVYRGFETLSSINENPLGFMFFAKELESGICPFVIEQNDDMDSIEDVTAYINRISEVYKTGYDVLNVPNAFFSDGKIILECDLPFVLIPSNASQILGFRLDGIYISVWDFYRSCFCIKADFMPKIDGPDSVYIQADEIIPLYPKNLELTPLATVYLPSSPFLTISKQTGIVLPTPVSSIQIENTHITFRDIKTVPKLSRLTLQLYSDMFSKTYYNLNGLPWFVELVIRTKK